MRARVVVVGAGLVGLAAAAELARRGSAVTVLERAIPGAEASTAAAGILGPQLEHDDDGPTLDLGLAGVQATRRLLERLGADVDLFTTAAAKLACDDDAAAALERRVRWQRARGLRVELVDGDTARARLPGLPAGTVACAFFPDDGCLDPRRYGEALHAHARDLGVTVVTGATLAQLAVERGRCVGVRLEDGRVVHGDDVVVCAGAWSSLVAGTGLSLDDVHPVRGQIVQLQTAPGTLDRVVYGPGGYVVPRADGRVVCGSTMERVGFDKSVTDDGIAHVRAMAARTWPALADAPVTSTWAGLRPATRDGLPYLGATELPGLWLSTGHFRNGVLLAAISAEALAALLLGDEPPVDVRPFSPLRATVREAEAGRAQRR